VQQIGCGFPGITFPNETVLLTPKPVWRARVLAFVSAFQSDIKIYRNFFGIKCFLDRSVLSASAGRDSLNTAPALEYVFYDFVYIFMSLNDIVVMGGVVF
jgi:hypothetical protein